MFIDAPSFICSAWMPHLSPYRVETIPSTLVPFHEAIHTTVTMPSSAVHFYISDRLFMPLFRCPDCYLESLRRYSYVIMPDLSQYRNWSAKERYCNHYYNRAMGAYLQTMGISVIANVTWSLPDSYDYAFDGLPCHTTIAINSNGANSDSLSKYLWIQGYRKAIERLQPTHILRYGMPVDGECTAISTYYPNPYITRLRSLPPRTKTKRASSSATQTELVFE